VDDSGRLRTRSGRGILEIYQDKVKAKSWLAAQIREAAEAFLEGKPWPESLTAPHPPDGRS